MLSTRQKGCFLLLGVHPICEARKGHVGGEFGGAESLRVRVMLMGAQVTRTDCRVFEQVISV